MQLEDLTFKESTPGHGVGGHNVIYQAMRILRGGGEVCAKALDGESIFQKRTPILVGCVSCISQLQEKGWWK